MTCESYRPSSKRCDFPLNVSEPHILSSEFVLVGQIETSFDLVAQNDFEHSSCVMKFMEAGRGGQ